MTVIQSFYLNSFLVTLANLCTNCLTGKKIKGVVYHNSTNLYYHASPLLKTQKEKWLEKILDIL